MYELRQATHADYDFLYRLHAAAIRPAVEATWGWDETWQQDYFREHFDPARRQIVRVDSQDVGVISVEERQDEHYLALIEILPSFQGRGIGTALIQSFIKTALGRDRPAALHVLKANDAARSLYERLGFQVSDEEEVKYRMIYAPQAAGNKPGETQSDR